MFIDVLLARFTPRFPEAEALALTSRVLLLRSDAGVGINIALGGLPFEDQSIDRSSEFEYLPGIHLRTCSAEDLVIHKAFAARPKDWLDVEGTLQRQVLLDWSYIEQQLPPLLELKKEPENWKTLMKLKASAP